MPRQFLTTKTMEMKIILINNKGNVIAEYVGSLAIDVTHIKAKYADCVRVLLPEVGVDLAI